MEVLLILFTLFLIIISILDFRYKAVPSIILTGMIFILTFVRFGNFQWAIIMGVFGLLIWEFSYENGASFGIADIKVMIMIGFFVANLMSITIFLIIFGFGQIIYLGIMNYFNRDVDEVEFIPFLTALWIGGLIGGLWI